MIIRDAEGHTHDVTNGRHLGDGCYVWHDGYQFWLGAERGAGWHVVALEACTLANFMKFVEQWCEEKGVT